MELQLLFIYNYVCNLVLIRLLRVATRRAKQLQAITVAIIAVTVAAAAAATAVQEYKNTKC